MPRPLRWSCGGYRAYSKLRSQVKATHRSEVPLPEVPLSEVSLRCKGT